MAGKNGGKRAGAGRPKGSTTKASKELRAECQAYAEEMVGILVTIARKKKAPEVARISAAKEVLDRGYGKSTSIVEGQLVIRSHADWLRELKEGSE